MGGVTLLEVATPGRWPHADPTVAARFAAKVVVPTPPVGRGCWIWTGAVETDSGYGRFHAGGGRRSHIVAAHRWSYAAAFGVPLDELDTVRHDCDERFCVNPACLRTGTRADNIADQIRRGRATGPGGFTRRPVPRVLAVRAAASAGDANLVRWLLEEPGIQLELHLDPT